MDRTKRGASPVELALGIGAHDTDTGHGVPDWTGHGQELAGAAYAAAIRGANELRSMAYAPFAKIDSEVQPIGAYHSERENGCPDGAWALARERTTLMIGATGFND